MLRRLALLVVCLLWASSAQAATYYTTKTGSDSNPCTGAGGNNATTLAFAKLTIKGGMGCLTAGDTLLVRAGDYDETIEPGNNVTLALGTSWANKIRIANYPDGCSPNAPNNCGTAGELVRLRPTDGYNDPQTDNIVSMGYFTKSQYVEFDGIDLDGSIATAGSLGGEVGMTCDASLPTRGANYIRFKNAEFTGNQGLYDRTQGGSSGGGDHFGLFKQGGTSTNCPGGFEIQNLKIHGGATNETGWVANGDPPNYGRYTAYAFYLGADNTLIENNEIYDTRYLGIQIYASGTLITGTIIRNNTWHDIVRGGYKSGGGTTSVVVMIDTGSGTVVSNNLLYNNGTPDGAGMGIECYDGGSGGKYLNNTVYGSTGTGFATTAGCSGATIQNNIFHLNAGGNYSNAGSGTTEDHNLRIGTDPNFVNAGTGDFHLSATSAAAIDVGLCLGQVPADHDGVTRPQGTGCDIGAYEYLPSGTLPGIPTNFVPASGASGVDLFPPLSFTSSNATAYDFWFSSFNGPSNALFTDVFDRANSADLGSDWTPFTIGFTNAQLVGNRVRNTATTGLESIERYSGTFSADHWARIRLSTFGTGEVSASIILRCQTGAQPSGYMIGARKGTAPYTTWAFRLDNGNFTFLAGDNATTWGTNDLLEAHIVGNTFTVYRNGNTDLRLTATDPAAAYASGGQCLYLYSTGLGQLEIDNFEAGNIGPVFVGTFATATYTPLSLIPNTVYYWKAAGRNATGTTTGPVIQFTTLGTTATPVGIRLRCVYGTANCP